MESTVKKRSYGIVLSYVYTILNAISGLFLSSYLLGALGNSEYGLYQTVTTFAVYLVVFEFGIGTVMSRNISVCRSQGDTDKIKNHTATLWYANLFLALIIIAIGVGFLFSMDFIYAKTISAEKMAYAKTIFGVVVVYLVFSFFTQSLNGVLIGHEKYSFAQIVNITKIVLKLLLVATIIIGIKYALVIAIVDLVLSAAAFLVTFIYCKTKLKVSFALKDFDKKILKDSLPLCFALLIQTVVNQANNNVDKTVLGIMVSLDVVAIYSVAQFIYTMFSSFSCIPISMYMPEISRNITSGKKGRELTETLVRPARLITLIASTILFGFVSIGKPFITLFYGADKLEVFMLAIILMAPMLIDLIVGILIDVLDVVKKRMVRSWVLLGTTALNIGLTILFVNWWGMLGAVIATAISVMIGQVTIMNIYYAKALKIDILYLYYKASKGIIIFELPIAVGVHFLSGFLSVAFVSAGMSETFLAPLMSFLIGGILFVALSGVCILFFGFNKTERAKMFGRFKKNKTIDPEKGVVEENVFDGENTCAEKGGDRLPEGKEDEKI